MIPTLGLIYFTGMLIALAVAVVELDDNAVDDPSQSMSDTALLAGAYMLIHMICWPYYAAKYVYVWLRDKRVSIRP